MSPMRIMGELIFAMLAWTVAVLSFIAFVYSIWWLTDVAKRVTIVGRDV